jgi:hypothetical protein
MGGIAQVGAHVEVGDGGTGYGGAEQGRLHGVVPGAPARAVRRGGCSQVASGGGRPSPSGRSVTRASRRAWPWATPLSCLSRAGP